MNPFCPDCYREGKAVSKDRFVCPYCHTVWTDRDWDTNVRLLQNNELPLGTLIKHPVHGIGRFAGKTWLRYDESDIRECICLEYDEGDKLFIPLGYIGILKVVKPGAGVKRLPGVKVKAMRDEE